jgi:hypothetical protein
VVVPQQPAPPVPAATSPAACPAAGPPASPRPSSPSRPKRYSRLAFSALLLIRITRQSWVAAVALKQLGSHTPAHGVSAHGGLTRVTTLFTTRRPEHVACCGSGSLPHCRPSPWSVAPVGGSWLDLAPLGAMGSVHGPPHLPYPPVNDSPSTSMNTKACGHAGRFTQQTADATMAARLLSGRRERGASPASS